VRDHGKQDYRRLDEEAFEPVQMQGRLWGVGRRACCVAVKLAGHQTGVKTVSFLDMDDSDR